MQILESKKMPEGENLFLRNLRSELTGEDIFKTLQVLKNRKLLDERDVYLDRVIKANPSAYKEATNMFSEETRDIIMSSAEERGWLEKTKIENAKEIAKNFLLLGISVENVAKATKLPIDVVTELAMQSEEEKVPVA